MGFKRFYGEEGCEEEIAVLGGKQQCDNTARGSSCCLDQLGQEGEGGNQQLSVAVGSLGLLWLGCT